MEKYNELTGRQKSRFVQAIDADRLLPYLHGELSSSDWTEINNQSTKAGKVEKLLELVPSKGSEASHALCVALENTYPHLLTLMHLPYVGVGGPSPASTPTTGSSSSAAGILAPDGRLPAPTPPDGPDDQRLPAVSIVSEEEKMNALPHMHFISTSPGPLGEPIPSASQTSVSLLKEELQLASNDKEILRRELFKVQEKLQGYSKLGTSGSDINGDAFLQVQSSTPEMHTARSIDQLRTQCDCAMNELSHLQKQHAETMRKCEQAVKEKEHYKLQMRDTAEKILVLENEIHSLKAQCNDIQAEKSCFEKEVEDLKVQREKDRLEILELRETQKEVMSESGSSEVLNKMYNTTVDKYDGVKKENETLRKQYTDLLASHHATTENLKLENSRLLKQYEEALQERDTVIEERNGLKQQCTIAIRNWDSSRREMKELQDKVNSLSLDRDKKRRDLERERAISMKVTRDFERLKTELDAHIREYALIMSERDEVHKEIKQLESKLADANKKAEKFDQNRKTSEDQLLNVRQEMTSAKRDRDNALKQIQAIKETYGEIISRKVEAEKEMDDVRKDIQHLQHKWEIAEQAKKEAIEDRDRMMFEQLEKTQKELSDEKEIEILHREVDRLRGELTDAQQLAEASRKNLDLACTERNKIVMERESIRTLCDKLRRDRDQRVSELFEALRETDELKKQKNNAIRELKEIRDKYDALLEKEARKSQLNSVGHNHSHDSAIDADLQEWETETLELTIGGHCEEEIGFDLGGGKEDPHFPNDHSLYVSSITKGGAADGKLRVNDQVVRINGVDVTNLEKKTAVELLCKREGVINVVVRRRKSTLTRAVHLVHLNLVNGQESGVGMEQGLYVSRIIPGSTAAKEGSLAVGDRILSINGRTVETMNAHEATKLLHEGRDQAVLNVLKCCPSPHPSLVSSSASSGHNLTETSPDTDTGLSIRTPDDLWSQTTDQDHNHSGDGSNLKTSCSQTDSLDSPCTSDNKHSQDIPSDQSRLKSPDEGFMEDKNSGQLMVRSHPKTKESRGFIVELASQHSINKKNLQSREDEVVQELNSVINQFTKNKNAKTKNKFRDKRKPDPENCGTWPKCHIPGDSSSYPPLPVHRRPPLENMINIRNNPRSVYSRPKSAYVPNTEATAVISPTSYKSPPKPPERSEASFIGIARHSPQNSDSSLKYPYTPNIQETANMGSGSFTVGTGVPKGQLLPEKLNTTFKDAKSGAESSSPSTSPGVPNFSRTTDRSHVDYTVGSVKDLDVLNTYSQRSRHRPNSAPGRNQQERREKAAQVHGPSSRQEHPAQKPSSLNVQPVFLPSSKQHSAQTMSPPSDHMISPRSHDQLVLEGHPVTQGKPQPFAHHQSSVPHSQAASVVVKTSTAFPVFAATSHKVSSSGRTGAHPLVSPHYYNSPPSFPSHESMLGPTHNRESDPGRLPLTFPYSSPSPSPSQQSTATLERSTPTLSEENTQHPVRLYPWAPPGSAADGCSTFPKCRPVPSERIHIPSIMMKSSLVSGSSLDQGSGRSSPFLQEHVRPHGPVYKAATMPRRPKEGEARDILMEKTSDPLGIQIQPGSQGGIYVSSVSENSLAAQAGIEVGDQLLEVCGLNMRNASYKHAAKVLRQCAGSITMRVLYNPRKYKDNTSGSSSQSSESNMSTPQHYCNPSNSHLVSDETITPSSKQSPSRQQVKSDSLVQNEPRFVFIQKTTPDLGIMLVGGNAIGIFVREVRHDSIAGGPKGLRCGDQILEFNGENLRAATAERAAFVISKPADTVSILAQHNYSKFKKAQEMPGDALYVRAGVDRQVDKEGELSFKKDDILYVDHTMYNGQAGLWRAWLLDSEGGKLHYGSVPSRTRLEDELALKRSISGSLADDDLRGSRRGSGSARRSFFRRKRHQRNNSKDSRDFNSFSDASINSDSIPVLDDGCSGILQHVEKLDASICRPVLIIGPLAEPLINKLTSESPDKYCRCKIETVPALKMGQEDGYFLDWKWRESHYEVVTVDSVQEVIARKQHCMLDMNPAAVERLHKVSIFPIVLFIKHKSPKQIREVKDFQFIPEKISHRSAKEMYELYQKYEQDYKHFFTDTVNGGGLAFMSYSIKNAITNAQKKTVWVPITQSS